MSNTQTQQLKWESEAFQKFTAVIQKIPLFHREIAKQVVTKKAQQNAIERNAEMVEEADILRAFFSEVPNAFYSLMVRLLEEVGFNYREYEPK